MDEKGEKIFCTYTFVRKGAFKASSIILRSSCVKAGPHGDCRHQREDPAGKDGCLHQPPLVLQLLVLQRHLDSEQSVPIHADKIVDGGAEKDDGHAGDNLTEMLSKSPPTKSDCVERDEKANQKVGAGKRDHDEVESLRK